MTTITREVKLKFDIQSSVDYKDFATNSQFSEVMQNLYNVFKDMSKSSVMSQFDGLFTDRLLVDYSLKTWIDVSLLLDKALNQIVNYDITEIFENINDEKIEEITKHFAWNPESEDSYEIFSFDILDMIQYHFTSKNKLNITPFIYKRSQEDYTQNIGMWEDLENLLTWVKYDFRKKENTINSYFMLYNIITAREDIYMIYKSAKDVVVCNEYNLTKNIEASSLVFNLTRYFMETVFEETQLELYQKMEHEYKKGKKSVGAFFKEVIELSKLVTWWTKIEVTALETNIKRLEELDESNITWSVTSHKVDGIKTHIHVKKVHKMKN